MIIWFLSIAAEIKNPVPFLTQGTYIFKEK